MTVLNGLNFGVYTAPQDRAATRRQLGIGDDEVLALLVARLWRPKRPEDLLHAVALARKMHPHYRGLVVGWEDARYEGHFPSYREELRQAAEAAGIGAFFHALDPRADVRPLYAAADIFAMPAIDEPFALVVVEAMAAGLPVVGVRSGATPEIVVEGETGLLAEPSNPTSLAACLIRLGEDAPLRARLGAAGRERVRTRFSQERVGPEFAAIYARISAHR